LAPLPPSPAPVRAGPLAVIEPGTSERHDSQNMIRETSGNLRAALVSFSGIDGAGKSTQIEDLCAQLAEAGLRVRILAFWDDVATLKGLREFLSRKLFHGEPGVGTPTSPVNRRDKNVRSWPMTALRFFLYFMDALSLRIMTASARRSAADVVIFDRYLYDELANLNMDDRLTRAYARLLLRMVPHPDLAYLLDVDPVQARARKPEYPLEFLHNNRASYLALSEIADGITVVAPASQPEVQRIIAETTLHFLRGELRHSAA
jgi:thymidylate kinase